MNYRRVALLAGCLLLNSVLLSPATETNTVTIDATNAASVSPTNPAPAAETNAAAADLSALIDQINSRLRAGARTEPELAPEISHFEELLTKYKTDKSEAVARILTAKAMLYLQVFNNADKAIENIRRSKQDFPETQTGKDADQFIAAIQAQQKARAIQNSQRAGAPFPDFKEPDLDGKTASISGYKGKVLLVDFWATWCVPCMMELPNVIAAYQKFHSQGFEIVGISLDTDEKALRHFLKSKTITWQQIYKGKRWDNELVQQYAVEEIPATFLLDREGRIVAKNLRGQELYEALEKLLSPPPAKTDTSPAPAG